jgi:hypothetical protein
MLVQTLLGVSEEYLFYVHPPHVDVSNIESPVFGKAMNYVVDIFKVFFLDPPYQ